MSIPPDPDLFIPKLYLVAMASEANITPCPNCGFEYSDDFHYCPECGQKNEDVVLSFKELVHDALGAFFAFDSKGIRSLPRLIFMPGSLTMEYVQGKRETYLAPFRLYLFISIVLFLLLPLIVKDDNIISNKNLTLTEEVGDSIITHKVPASDFLEQFTEDNIQSPESVINDDPVVDSIEGMTDRSDAFSLKGADNDLSILNFGSNDSAEANNWTLALALVEEGLTPSESIDSIFPGQRSQNKFFLKQGLKLHSRRGEGIVSSLLDVASYTLFIFLPFFALWLKLLYVRRKRFYIEHLIFSLHFFSFFFLLIIIYILLFELGFKFPFWIIILMVLAYLYAAMYRVYGQGAFKTFFKWFALIFTTSVFFLPVFSAIAVFIAVLFY